MAERKNADAGFGFKTSMAMVLLLAGVAMLSAGCLSVEAPKEINVDVPDYYQSDYRDDRDDDRREDRKDRRRDKEREKNRRRKLGKSEAYDIAKDLARDQGAKVKKFDVKDKKIEGVYWILFERKRRRSEAGWRNHFAVRVARGKHGKTRATLYKGGRAKDFGGRMDKDNVKKDEAYRFAKKLARKRGVRVRNYKIEDKKIDGNYWIIFEREDSRAKPGRRDNLAVRVSKRGRARLYR